jgi:hypothetical protein
MLVLLGLRQMKDEIVRRKMRRSRHSGSDRPSIQRGNQMAMVCRNGVSKIKRFDKKASFFLNFRRRRIFLCAPNGLELSGVATLFYLLVITAADVSCV